MKFGSRVLKNIITGIVFGCFVLCMTGCEKSSDNTEPSDVITFMNGFKDTEENYSLSRDGFVQAIDKFISENPDIHIKEERVRGADYHSEVAACAVMGHGLPDVFILPISEVNKWAEAGYIADISDYTNKNLCENFDQDALSRCFSNERLYGYPVSYQNYLIIVYDKLVWNSIGYDLYPKSWEELIEADKSVKNLGYESTIGISALGSGQSGIFNTLIYHNCGDEWVQNVSDNSPMNLFTQKCFEDTLAEINNICNYGIIPSNYNAGYGESTLDYFIEGKCPSAVIDTESLNKLRKIILERDADRYNQLEITYLPASYYKADEGAPILIKGVSEAIVINSEVAKDPDKMKKCIRLCEYMSGNAFSDYMMEKYGMVSQYKSDAEYKGLDDTWDGWMSFIYSQLEENIRMNIYQILDGSVSAYTNSLLWRWTEKNDYSAKEIANYFQDAYEGCGNYKHYP